jgi:hypothetical protein
MELEKTIFDIQRIFLDYLPEISIDTLDIIAKRIATEVIGINDDNEFVNLPDLNK